MTYICNNSKAVTIPITCQSNHKWLVGENSTCPAKSKNITSQHILYNNSLSFHLRNDTTENESKLEKENSTDKWTSITKSNPMNADKSAGTKYLFLVVIPVSIFLIVLLATFAMISLVFSCTQVLDAYNENSEMILFLCIFSRCFER